MSPNIPPRKKIKIQIKQIDELIDEYEELINAGQTEKPNKVEIAALASVLHSFYNGLENIFKIIAREIDGIEFEGEKWHRELLEQMNVGTPNRKAIITDDIIEITEDYMSFRHFYRHSYSYLLEWNKMDALVKSLQEVWTQIKNNLGNLIEEIERS